LVTSDFLDFLIKRVKVNKKTGNLGIFKILLGEDVAITSDKTKISLTS